MQDPLGGRNPHGIYGHLVLYEPYTCRFGNDSDSNCKNYLDGDSSGIYLFKLGILPLSHLECNES